MNFKSLTLALALSSLTISAVAPAFAAGTAATMSVKIGYFNLHLVKASFPEAAGSETLRVQAENQLRRDVEEGNKVLQKLQSENKPKEEIEKKARDLQTEINAKQQALIQLVQTQQAIANQTIGQAVAQVAKEKGLDLVIDASSVYAGADKVVSNGEDITDSIVKKLAPAVLKSGSSNDSKPAPKPAAAPSAGGTK